jgi:hypothetical protein
MHCTKNTRVLVEINSNMNPELIVYKQGSTKKFQNLGTTNLKEAWHTLNQKFLDPRA